MVAGDDRPHVHVRAAVGRADPHPPGQVAEPVNQAIGDAPDRQGQAPGHAPLPGAAEGRRLHRPGRLVEVGVGHDDQVVLGPARRLHPLAVPGAGLVDMPCHWPSSRRTRSPPPGGVRAGRRRIPCRRGRCSRPPPAGPTPISSSPSRTAESGTFSEGFKTNVLPQASATGIIQSGTITGKLNGRDPGADADRVADRLAVHVARDVRQRLAPSGGWGFRRRTRPSRYRAGPRPATRSGSCRARE